MIFSSVCSEKACFSSRIQNLPHYDEFLLLYVLFIAIRSKWSISTTDVLQRPTIQHLFDVILRLFIVLQLRLKGVKCSRY
jgi:hypothetical protein